MERLARSCWAEFLGTFALCFAGQGAICVQQLLGARESGLLPVAIAHGLALGVMISALGAVSGGHFNPAVTLGFLVTGRQRLGSGAAYVAFQLAGAAAASLLLCWLFPVSVWQAVHLGAAALSPEVSAGGGLLVEFVLTFFLVTAVWGTAVDERGPRVGGFAIGLAVTLGILVGGPLTGAALNPARAFGPALVGCVWDSHWIYWVGPLAGGAAAAMVYDNLFMGAKGAGASA